MYPPLLLAAAQDLEVAKLRVQASLTPLWILGMGVSVGFVLCVLLVAVLYAIRRGWGEQAIRCVREGAMWPLFWMTLAISVLAWAVLGVSATGVPTVIGADRIIDSLARWPLTGVRELHVEVKGAEKGQAVHQIPPQEFPVDFRANELLRMRGESSVSVLLFTQMPDPVTLLAKGGRVHPIAYGDEFKWEVAGGETSAFAENDVTALYVVNESEKPGVLDLVIETAPVHPEALDMLWAAGFVVCVFGLYLLMSFFMPRVSAVALATTKSELAQPLFWILAAVGSFLILAFMVVPYNTFGDDVKMLKSSCFDLILVISLIQAIWTSGNSVSDEIEGRTALTVLSKPLTRAQFILGKFVGISWVVFLMFAILGVIFLSVVSYKPLYDAVESTREDPLWQQVHAEVVRSLPGLALGLMQTMVLASLSIAISTRLPLMANFIISFCIYALGNITPMLVQSQSTSPGFAPVRFVAQFVALLPMLEHFDMETAVVSGVAAPLSYLGMAFLYSAIYATIAMLIALLLFEDRDLA